MSNLGYAIINKEKVEIDKIRAFTVLLLTHRCAILKYNREILENTYSHEACCTQHLFSEAVSL